MDVINRNTLLQIENTTLTTDILLMVTALSRGTLQLDDVPSRLKELGHSDSDRTIAMKLLAQSCHTAETHQQQET